MLTVFTHGGKNYFDGARSKHMIELQQEENARHLFTLVYGLQVSTSLTYAEAARQLGEVILHHACCEGLAFNDGE